MHSVRGQFSYTIENGEVTVFTYMGSSANVTVPSSINGYPVTGVGSAVFGDFVQTVSLPATVRKIYPAAFAYSDNLRRVDVDPANQVYSSADGVLFNKARTEIVAYPPGRGSTSYTIPEGVQVIGYMAFAETFTTNVVISSAVTNIDNYAFHRSHLVSATIGPAILRIGLSAFAECLSLREVTITGNLATLEPDAFDSCFALEKVSLPPGLMSIGSRAFYACYQLKEVVVPDAVTNLASEAFASCENLTNIVLPSGLQQISAQLFDRCSHLKTVVIPPGVTKVERMAFNDCADLISVDIPNAVTNIGDGAFANSGLLNVRLPDALMDIPPRLFNTCSNLESVTFPPNLTTIGEEAFRLCSRLQAAVFPASLTNIGDRAFIACESLSNISLPENLVEVGAMTFGLCSSATNLVLPQSLRSIREFAFNGCSRLPVVNIPSGVEAIWPFAFVDCSSLTAINVDPANTQFASIAGVLFSKDCSKLICYPIGQTATSYHIPPGVTQIDDSAFQGSATLQNISAPESVVSVGSGAFQMCPALKAVYFGSDAPPYNPSVFINTTATVYYLPDRKNWGPEFCGRPTILWNPVVIPRRAVDGQFGFTISGNNGIEGFVEAAADLNAPDWQPLGSFTIVNDSVDLTEPLVATGARFLRLRSP